MIPTIIEGLAIVKKRGYNLNATEVLYVAAQAKLIV